MPIRMYGWLLITRMLMGIGTTRDSLNKEWPMRTKALGIDPDASGGVCALVDVASERVTTKRFPITDEGMSQLVKWISRQGELIVAIEGRNGQSDPFERALRKAAIVFYSFTAHAVAKFRSAMLGQNKNNQKDAEAVARYALTLETQGLLERSRRVWFVDEELQTLTRLYAVKRRENTREISRLWKILHKVCGDLYLAFRGRHPDYRFHSSLLQQRGVVRLLAEQPDVSSWHLMSEKELMGILGGSSRERAETVVELQRLSASLAPLRPSHTVMVQTTAATLLTLSESLDRMKSGLDELTQENLSVCRLRRHAGIGVLTAATIIAEIIDIRRFPSNNHLASYAGLARREYKTGRSTTEIAPVLYNHRLKNAFFSAAKNFILYNPDSHLSAYYRMLVARGMSITEAYKRVARALVRVFYRELTELVTDSAKTNGRNSERKSEDGMATGTDRQAQVASSNIPPSTEDHTPTQRQTEPEAKHIAKAIVAMISETENRRKRNVENFT